jgi:hypothetical protein
MFAPAATSAWERSVDVTQDDDDPRAAVRRLVLPPAKEVATVMEQAAWIFLAILFSGLLIALIKGGWTGAGGASSWYKAKFLGQPK